MATKKILLTRLWDGHPAGEVVEEQDYTVESMIRKGYGMLYQPDKRVKSRPGRGPHVETMTAAPPAETADVTPQSESRPGRKAGE